MTAPAFPADAFGNAVPLLPVQYGNSIAETAVTTSGITAGAQTVGDGLGGVIRVWAIGCDLYYKTGIAGLSAASNLDALIAGANSPAFFDVPLPQGHTTLRAITKTGSGFIRIEKLG